MNAIILRAMKIEIAERDIPDFYCMLRDNQRNRGNTFVYLQQELEALYIDLLYPYLLNELDE